MAGETIKSEAICLNIRPWSRTSHVVSWLTPRGKVSTVVRGAERAKSFFLGQYDLNYTCEILYYARAKGELHALREAYPVRMREGLRGDYRALALAGYYRRLVGELAPVGPECAAWYALLDRALDACAGGAAGRAPLLTGMEALVRLLRFELEVLRLSGLSPDFSGYDAEAEWSSFNVETGSFGAELGGRQVRIGRETAEFLANPQIFPKKSNIPLDAARVISVFYTFHVDGSSEARRSVLRVIS